MKHPVENKAVVPIDGKRPDLWIATLTVWVIVIVILQRPLFFILFSRLSLMQWLCLSFFIGWTDFAWLCGVYQLSLFVFGKIEDGTSYPKLSNGKHFGENVAILYTTMNDFVESAALSCVEQEYPTFHVYLLDDSTDARFRSDVDAFHSRFPQSTTVVRRHGRAGFKAIGAGHVQDKHSADPMMHKTATVDYIIVLKGEIHAIMEAGEKLLKAGDVLIQRGTNHSWSVRSKEPCIVAAVLVSADPVDGGH